MPPFKSESICALWTRAPFALGPLCLLKYLIQWPACSKCPIHVSIFPSILNQHLKLKSSSIPWCSSRCSSLSSSWGLAEVFFAVSPKAQRRACPRPHSTWQSKDVQKGLLDAHCAGSFYPFCCSPTRFPGRCPGCSQWKGCRLAEGPLSSPCSPRSFSSSSISAP